MRKISLLITLLICVNIAFSQEKQATWIWYPGDFEIWLGNQMQNRRTERNAFIPPFWRVYSHHPLVNFTKEVELATPEEVTIAVEGKYNVTIDSKYVQTDLNRVHIPAGKHTINLQVFNETTPPAVYVSGSSIASGKDWEVKTIRNNYPDNIPGNDPPVYADAWAFDSEQALPSRYQLPTKLIPAASTKRDGQQVLVDFGKESFGFLTFRNLKGTGTLHVYYGESKEEALSTEFCETLDHFQMENASGDFTTDHSRALRYANIVAEGTLSFDAVDLLYEYLPVTHRGTFTSSDPLLNNIWQVSEYTLELTTREFFIDGIKRDRWIWSGDANQSYLMNYYSFFDNPAVKRTIRQLRGGEPVEAHINTILDYSFYWFMSMYDYYLYTGDEAMLKQMYPKMVTLMDFCLSRRNKDGFVEGLPGDWVFLDWAPITKDGELSAVQMLFCRSLETMALCATLVNDTNRAREYDSIAATLKKNIFDVFWDKEKQVILHSRKQGVLDNKVTRYGNMFAMMFGYLDAAQTEAVKQRVLLNDSVQKITTPYMRFYELEALCAIGQQQYVTQEIKDYWGGMLAEGATSFWELYDPKEKGVSKYAMYGRPFGKSLCHAWGASPVYLLGKYYLGVKPTKPGYEEYTIEPKLGGLETIEGKVPTPHGDIWVKASTRQIQVHPVKGKGVLKFQSAKKPSAKGGNITKVGKNHYELALEEGKTYEVTYAAVKQP